MRQLTAGIGSRESELDKRLRKWMGGYETECFLARSILLPYVRSTKAVLP